jgi:flagellar biosynthesis anti-sigma factor FlgM
MKIQGNTPGVQSGATEQLNKTADTGAAARGKSASPASSTGDQLSLSPEARAIQALADAGSEPPPVRQDVVDRMRELLDRGEIGKDADALANSIIKDLLKQS